MMTYQERLELRDPEKPHRRVFLCDDGTHVKVHAVAVAGEFGRVQWTFTGSHCDSQGKAFPYADGFAIHPDAHEVTIASDADLTPEDIETKFREGVDRILRRVHRAMLNERAAAALVSQADSQGVSNA
jgi:hypothetical protein